MRQLLQKTIQVDHQNGYTSGHFDGHPIVPGAVSLYWMLEAAAQAIAGDPFETFEIRNLKCLQELPPPCEVLITVFEKRPGAYYVQLDQNGQLTVCADILLPESTRAS